MALVLGLNVGDVVDIADHWIAALSVDGKKKATLIVKGGRKIAVFSKGVIELVPDVWVQLGPWISKKHVKLLALKPMYRAEAELVMELIDEYEAKQSAGASK